jgi:hypothetical protein
MTKDEARREVVKRWRALPAGARQTHAHLSQFAHALAQEIVFETLADRTRLIEAWLIKDMEHRDAVLQEIDARVGRQSRPPAPAR